MIPHTGEDFFVFEVPGENEHKYRGYLLSIRSRDAEDCSVECEITGLSSLLSAEPGKWFGFFFGVLYFS